MKSTITTTLEVKGNTVSPLVLDKWLTSLPSDATLTFVIQKGYSDPRESVPTEVTGIKATWTQEF